MTHRCPRYHCNAPLAVGTNGNGRDVVACAACDRNRRGLCRDCPALLEHPRARRCRSCNTERQRQLDRRRSKHRDNSARVIGHAERLYRRRWMRAYRSLNRRDDTDRLVAREKMRRRRQDPAFRRKEAAAKRRRRRLELAA